MRKIIFIIGVILLSSCANQKTTTYYPKLIYTDYSKDSIFFVEFNRNGTIRHSFALPISRLIIKQNK